MRTPCLPGEGRRVAKASQGGPPTLAAPAESAERSGGLQRSEGWGMTCLREEAAPLSNEEKWLHSVLFPHRIRSARRFSDAANAVSPLDVNDQVDQIADLALDRSVWNVYIGAKR